ncbi:MAG: hypothetical protein EZS28_023287 [Streblomastix strix]|uniref:Uncharacterized protein n=1 Tax=Streblomastix strix TaxID=222440 RepID=A0A5J4VF50_9EUKA|nr:MAG: hypothetical protein EZS28_023287 [Streblomastix strix]
MHHGSWEEQWEPFELLKLLWIRQTPYAASQFNYRRGAAVGRRFQSRRCGGRGRGAFGFNFKPLRGQCAIMGMSIQSECNEEVTDSAEQGVQRSEKRSVEGKESLG